MSFVTVKLWAQLGNQMFMIAATIAHALKHGVEYKIPSEGHSPELRVMPFPHLPEWKTPDGLGAPYVERPEQFGLYHEMPYWPKMRLHGYFQNELYFKDYRKEILDAFRIPCTPVPECSIHVRRGDYLQHPTKHPAVTMDYIDQAIDNIILTTNCNYFKVFSDDIEWCISAFKERFGEYSIDHFEFMERGDALSDLSKMSSCSHHIIANSTYSWWGAWICQNPDKVVVCPKQWFGPGNSHLNSSQICPATWLRV